MQPEHRGQITSWVVPARQQCSTFPLVMFPEHHTRAEGKSLTRRAQCALRVMLLSGSDRRHIACENSLFITTKFIHKLKLVPVCHNPYIYLIRSHILVEMLNIVGERERPNLGFARDVRAA